MKGNKIMDETMIFDGHGVSAPANTQTESAHASENDTATKVISMKAVRLKKNFRNSEAASPMEATKNINSETEKVQPAEQVMAEPSQQEEQIQETVSESAEVKTAEKKPVSKAKKRKLKLSCPAKTIFMSFVFAMWIFGNFFVLANDMTFQFYFSFLTMSATFALLCLERWFVRMRYIGVSIIIQQITLIAAWVFYIRHASEPVSHWMALMYAGYHLVMPSCMLLVGLVFRKIGRTVQAITDKFNARVAKVKEIQARRAARAAMAAVPQPAGMEVLTTPEVAEEAVHNLSAAEDKHESAESSSTVA